MNEEACTALETEEQLESGQLAPNAAHESADQIFAADPRTMWAWAQYLEHGPVLEVSSKDARQVLAAIPAGDHVEIFASVATTREYFIRRGNNAVPPQAKFAAKTFDDWILPGAGRHAEVVPGSMTTWSSSKSGSIVDRVAENDYRMIDGQTLIAYTDSSVYKRFSDGVGGVILRLPDNPLAPTPPALGTASNRAAADCAPPRRLLGDWRTAEDGAR